MYCINGMVSVASLCFPLNNLLELPLTKLTALFAVDAANTVHYMAGEEMFGVPRFI